MVLVFNIDLYKELKVGATKFLILTYVYQEGKRILDGLEITNRLSKYIPLKAKDLENIFYIDNSVISKHIRKLIEMGLIEKDVFGYCLSQKIEQLFNEYFKSKICKSFSIVQDIFQIFGSIEHKVILSYLAQIRNETDDWKQQKRNVYKTLPFSTKTLNRAFVRNNFDLKIENNSVKFSNRIQEYYRTKS